MVDVDWYVEDDQPKYRLIVDKEKAALNGISEDEIARTMALASAGYQAGLLHADPEKEDVPLMLRLDRATPLRPRAHPALQSRRARRTAGGAGRTGHAREQVIADKSIYHKNLMPVTYVTADVAGAMESPVYAILKLGPEIDKFAHPGGYEIEQHMAALPESTRTLRHEMGRRVAHHLRGFPRPGTRLRRRADPDLCRWWSAGSSRSSRRW